MSYRDRDHGRRAVASVSDPMSRLAGGAWDDDDDVFMGPSISGEGATITLMSQKVLIEGAAMLTRPTESVTERSDAFGIPGLIDVSDLEQVDEAIFAQLSRLNPVTEFDAAIARAEDDSDRIEVELVSRTTALVNRLPDIGELQQRLQLLHANSL